MDVETFVAALVERNEKSELMVALLNEVVDRTGDTREGYYSLRRYMDLSFGITNRYAIASAMTSDDLRDAMVRDLDNVLSTLQADIDRIDT